MQIYDSYLYFENFSFKGRQVNSSNQDPSSPTMLMKLNPRNPFQTSDALNYDMDSEDEMQELMGEDMLDSGEEEDEYYVESETGQVIYSKCSVTDNDADLEEEGWIVPDDYVSSDSDDEQHSQMRMGENDAEFELRRQQREIEK